MEARPVLTPDAHSERLSSDLASLRIVRDAPPPRPSGGGRYGTIVAVVVGVVLLVGLVIWAKPYAEAQLFKTEVTLTEVGLVSPAQASVDLSATGYVVPQIVAKVGAKVMGRVTKVNIREGASTKAGAVLFELDPTDQRAAVASAQARAASARAKAASARARATVARANLVETKQQADRIKKLADTGAETRAQADDLGARAKSLEEQVHAADADASAAEADVGAAQAEVVSLSATLASMTVSSPIDGTAVAKPSEVGDVVTPGTTLVELADFSSLLIEVDVPEGRLAQVKKGSPCEVVLDAAPNQRLRGETVDVSPRLNRAKASATVKVKIVDAADRLLPEMAARVSFLQKALDVGELKEPPKKVIPSGAVVERSGAKVAFVVENGKVRMVPLVLGGPFGDGFEVKDGPSPGTRLVKDPPATLADGQAVKEKGGEG
jgi:RND family efflux transporter MFP subunit